MKSRSTLSKNATPAMNKIKKKSDVKSMTADEVRSLLQFFAKRHPCRTQKALARLAEIDAENIQASLAGRRTLAAESVPLIAAALGLRYDADEGVLTLAQECVAQVEVSLEELDLLDAVVRSVTSGPPRWVVISKLWVPGTVDDGADESAPGIYTLLIGRIAESYLVVHLIWPSLRDAIDQGDFSADLSTKLYGSWDLNQGPGISVSAALWLRLRAGVIGTRFLDSLFGDKVRPTISEWANLLLALEAKGATPQSVLAKLSE